MATDAVGARAVRALQILTDSGAVLSGDHFGHVTGEHGDGWLDKDAIVPHTDITRELCRMLADLVADLPIDFVCGPATGGLIVSQWTAHHLGVPSLFAEHGETPTVAAPGGGPLRPPLLVAPGYDRLLSGARVIVVDDVVNTGHSIRQTAQAVRDCGGRVIAAAALCTRGNASASDVACPELRVLTEILIPSWPAGECRLCLAGVPVNARYAHGRDFVESQRRPAH